MYRKVAPLVICIIIAFRLYKTVSCIGNLAIRTHRIRYDHIHVIGSHLYAPRNGVDRNLSKGKNEKRKTRSVYYLKKKLLNEIV